MSDNKLKKTVPKWINVYMFGSKRQCNIHDSMGEAQEEVREYPQIRFLTTEPQQIEIEDIWS